MTTEVFAPGGYRFIPAVFQYSGRVAADRVVVLDHGEKIFDGAPKAAQSDAKVVEVYLGAEAA